MCTNARSVQRDHQRHIGGARHQTGGMGDVDSNPWPARPSAIQARNHVWYSQGDPMGRWAMGMGGVHGSSGRCLCRPATPISRTSSSRSIASATRNAATAVPPGTSCQHCSNARRPTGHIMARERVAPRARLAGILWPGGPPESPRTLFKLVSGRLFLHAHAAATDRPRPRRSLPSHHHGRAVRRRTAERMGRRATESNPERRVVRPRPPADARHLRRRDPGARGRRPHLLRLRHRHRRRRGARSSSSSTWPASAGTRPATSRSRCKLGDHMGTEIGEFAEQTLLFEAACNPDPVLRLTGVNRALEGLAIDVFNTMKDFGDDRRRSGARVLRGLDAGRRGHPREDGLRLAAPPHRERPRAAASARSSSSARSTASSTSAASAARSARSPIGWPAKFRELAGFTTEEIDEIADDAGGRTGPRPRRCRCVLTH